MDKHILQLDPSRPLRGLTLDAESRRIQGNRSGHPTGSSPSAPSQAAAAASLAPPPCDPAQLVDAIVEQLQQVEQNRLQAIHELRELALEIALAATAKVFAQEIDANQFPLQQIIESVIPQASNQPINLHLNPHDWQTLQQTWQDAERILQQHQVTIRADRELARGTCRVQSERFDWLRDPVLLIEDIRQSILEVMEDASTERRNTPAANSPLQRFPERRSAS